MYTILVQKQLLERNRKKCRSCCGQTSSKFVQATKAQELNYVMKALMLQQTLLVAINFEKRERRLIIAKKKRMSSLKGILMMSKEELDAFLNDMNCETTGVQGLVKLLSENIHTRIANAITQITEQGYSAEEAERAILRCGPFTSNVSNIVDRALLHLQFKNKIINSSTYAFEDVNKLVDFMTLEMVTTVREMKPASKFRKSSTPISVTEAVWNLLMCDMNVRAAIAQSEWRNGETLAPNRVALSAKKKTKGSQKPKSGKKPVQACGCECKRLSSMEQDAVLGQKVAEAFQKGGVKAMQKEIMSELTSVNKQQSSSSCSCELQEIRLEVEVTEVKTAKNQHLNNIPCDEKGEYMPRDEKDILRLQSVSQLQALKRELQRWSEWANFKVMEVTKQVSQTRADVKKLNSEREEAEKLRRDGANTEENVHKKLAEKSLVLNKANTELNVTSATIVKLKSEQAVMKEEMEKEKNRSLLEAKKLEEALIQEEEALKRSQSFGSERNGLEEELKGLRRHVAQKQRDIEKAECLLKETEIRVEKEVREKAKIVGEAESIKMERESIEALGMAEHNTTKKKSNEELQKYETEKKRLEYEISSLNLEAESKRIAAMQKSINMNMNMDSSKRLEVFKNIRSRKKKDRECVMCLSEEMAIVFVPCGHRVLCKGCNVKHEERMNECPFCMSPIHKRIEVRFAKNGV